MAKTSFVLRALKILGLEDMLKLSKLLHANSVPLKKAAGEELIVWDDVVEAAPQKLRAEEAKVLSFPKKSINDFAFDSEKGSEKSEDKKDNESHNLLAVEVVLWQREIARGTEDNVHKLEAFKGYKKSTEMYVVKTPADEGKDKIRFASTNGVLVNKKQA